ncbi:unnamed protein product [Caenorhabditis brenneri]
MHGVATGKYVIGLSHVVHVQEASLAPGNQKIYWETLLMTGKENTCPPPASVQRSFHKFKSLSTAMRPMMLIVGEQKIRSSSVLPRLDKIRLPQPEDPKAL